MSPKFYFIGFFCCLLITQGSTGDGSNNTVDTTTVKPDNTETTTIETTEKTTTTEPTTTTTPTTTTPKSTTSPTTTTTTTTTTPKPSTTSPTTTTTELTTTPVAPSTTPAPSPAPLPEPEVGSWVLSNSSTNLTCVIIHMALRMKIPYISTVNKTQSWGLLNLPKNANLTGKCDEVSKESNVSQVKLSWGPNNTDYLLITFKRYNDSKSFNITHLYLTQNVSANAFPNNSMSGMMHYQGNGSGLFSSVTIPLGSSYKCSHKANINLTEVNSTDPKGRNAILTFSKVQIQAFVNSTSGTFGAVFECPGMDASDIVPIAVGCALAALVIAVLIAYLIGRRRSHARGYLSM